MLYVNWRKKEIITDEEFKQRIEDEIENYFDDYDFNKWLNNNYSATEIWNMSTEESDEVDNEFEDWCKEEAERNLLADGWEEYELF